MPAARATLMAKWNTSTASSFKCSRSMGRGFFPPLEVGGVQQFAGLDDEGEGKLLHPFVVRHILEMARFIDGGVERRLLGKEGLQPYP